MRLVANDFSYYHSPNRNISNFIVIKGLYYHHLPYVVKSHSIGTHTVHRDILTL